MFCVSSAGSSHWASRNLLIETGCEDKPANGVFVEAYNGAIERQSSEGKVTRVQLSYLEHLPDSSDRTILTVRSGALAFGLAIDDLLRNRGMYIRDAGIFVSDAVSGLTFASYMASGGFQSGADIVSQVQKAEEQSIERARAEVPALSMQYRSGSHSNRYVPVGFFGNREKYGVEFNGNLFISKAGSKVFAEELARMAWSGDTLSYRIGTGPVPDFRERENAARQHVLDDYQPVVITDWSSQGIRYSEEAFSTLLDVDLDPLRNRGDELSAVLVRFALPMTLPRRAGCVAARQPTGGSANSRWDSRRHSRCERRVSATAISGSPGGLRRPVRNRFVACRRRLFRTSRPLGT